MWSGFASCSAQVGHVGVWSGMKCVFASRQPYRMPISIVTAATLLEPLAATLATMASEDGDVGLAVLAQGQPA